jgi:long-chain acyl-CoA synthetase
MESEILKSPYVSECLVCGRNTDEPGQEVTIEAIVVPNAEYFIAQGLDESRIEPFLRKEVKERCQKLAVYKRITKITVQRHELEKTTTGKVKRYLYMGKAPVSAEGASYDS